MQAVDPHLSPNFVFRCCNCSVVKAVQDQVAKGIHLQQNCTISQPTVELLERLAELAPKGISRFFFNCEEWCIGERFFTWSFTNDQVTLGGDSATMDVHLKLTRYHFFLLIQSGAIFGLSGTGSEAVESAVKLARHETGKQNIIHFKGGFHGRSLATLAMTTSKGVCFLLLACFGRQ